MIKLIGETDPKRVLPRNLIGKQILVRTGNDVFMATVVRIADDIYVFRYGIPYKLSLFDGWCELPIVNINEEQRSL